MPARWTWQLCLAGTALGELATAAGRTLTFQRNAFGRATCAIAHEDDAAQLLMTALRSGVPTLKCWRWGPSDTVGTLRFNGYLAAIDEELEETGLLTLDFRGPFARLVGEGNQRGRYTPNYIGCTAQDAGAAANSLVMLYGGRSDGAVGGTDPVFINANGAVTYGETSYAGLDIGTTQATNLRTLTYQRANVGESIQALSAMQGGFDFTERYVDGGSTLALLDIFASQGGQQANVKWEYGPTTLRNVRSVSRATEPPINTVVLLGAYGLVSTATDATSVAQYGRWYYQETRSDIFDQATLDATANALLRPNWVKTLQFTPETTTAPSPWDDYWLGDTGSFFGRRGSFSENSQVRVNGVTVAIDENGLESTQIPDPIDPEGERVLRAEIQTEVVVT